MPPAVATGIGRGAEWKESDDSGFLHLSGRIPLVAQVLGVGLTLWWYAFRATETWLFDTNGIWNFSMRFSVSGLALGIVVAWLTIALNLYGVTRSFDMVLAYALRSVIAAWWISLISESGGVHALAPMLLRRLGSTAVRRSGDGIKRNGPGSLRGRVSFAFATQD